MLNRHSRLRVPRESVFLIPLMDALPLSEPLDGPQLARAYAILSTHERWLEWEVPQERLDAVWSKLARPTLGELIDAVFRQCDNPEQKPRWGDKTPHYTNEIPRLAQVFPQAKFIHIIRDARDVVTSLSNRYELMRHLGYAMPKRARHWAWRVSGAMQDGQALEGHRFFYFHYEDLVLAPEETLREICSFLRESYEPAMLGFYEGSMEELHVREHKIHNRLMRPPKPTDVQRWRHEMKRSSLLLVEAVAGPTMRQVEQEPHYRGIRRLLPLTFYAVYSVGRACLLPVFQFLDNRGFAAPGRLLKRAGII